MVLRKISNGLEIVALIAFSVFVVMLFANSPTAPAAAPPDVVAAAGGIDGAATYGQHCAGCHGGDGSGGIGPRLAGRVAAVYPDPAAQEALVSAGRRGMPSFGGRLSPAEIAAVVDYTRTLLGT